MGFRLCSGTMVAMICAVLWAACLSSPPAQSGDGGPEPIDARAIPEGRMLVYLFDEGSGATVFDQSDVEPGVDLLLTDLAAATWNDGFLTLNSPTRLVSIEPPAKLVEACQQSNELTIEAWVATPHEVQPAETSPQRIVSLSDDAFNSNFLLGQDENQWIARVRTSATEPGGDPLVVSSSTVAAGTLTHLVFVRGEGRDYLYIDGAVSGIELERGGTFEPWDSMFPLIVGNENQDERAWLGDIHMLALYARALDSEEIAARYVEGPE